MNINEILHVLTRALDVSTVHYTDVSGDLYLLQLPIT